MSIECTYCEEKVNFKRGIYIKCTQCQDVKLCLECFSAGVVLADHDNDHPYQLIDCGSFSIIDEAWKAHEELALLEAIELYGLGSWTDIANAVETRSADECRERYLNVYVDNFFGRCTWGAIDKSVYNVHDHTCLHNQPLSPSLSLPKKHKIVEINREQQIRLGYMPKRDDFEREYDNEAELLVSKLAVHANDDTDLDENLKIAHINMYTDKLRERFRRKRVVLEYNLVKLFFHMHPEENGDTDHPNEPQITSNHLNTTSNEQLNLLPQRQQQQQLIKQCTLTETALKQSTVTASNPSNANSQSSSSTKHDGPDELPSQQSQTRDFKHSLASSYQSKSTYPSPDKSTSGKVSPTKVQNTILNYFQRIEPVSTSVTAGDSGTKDDNEANEDKPDTRNDSSIANASDPTGNLALISESAEEINPSDQPGKSILSSYFSDLNKSMAEQDFNSMEKKLRIFCQFGSVEEHNQLISNLALEKELKVRIKELIKKRRNGIKYHQCNQANGSEQETTTTKPSPSSKKAKVSHSNDCRNIDEPMEVDNTSINQMPTKVNQKKQNNGTNLGDGNQISKNESRKPTANLDFKQGWRLLSESEKRLCNFHNLKPSSYMSYKAYLLNVSINSTMLLRHVYNITSVILGPY